MTSSTTEDGGGPPPLLDVGRIVKPHGLTGEVVVELFTDRAERLADGTALQTDDGALVVESSRPHQGRHLVRFAGIADRSSAERCRGLALRAPAVEDPDVLWVHDLVGARVVGIDGTDLGVVVAVEANPASDLLVLEGGGLVPLRFVTAVDAGGRITVDVPPGLLD